ADKVQRPARVHRVANDRIGPGRNDRLILGDFDGRRRERVFSIHPNDETKPDRNEHVSGDHDAERHGGPLEAVVESGHDQDGDETEGRGQHDEPLSRPLLRRRTAPHSALEKSRVPSQQIERSQGRRGRKRHLVVDPLGLLLAVTVTSAKADDGTAAPRVLGRLSPEATSRLETVWGDGRYHNRSLQRWLRWTQAKYKVKTVSRPE